jgi:asparagine synthase (glutamine-hydrolysing)
MCGIAGVFDPVEARPIDPNILTQMKDSLFHRGPDGDGEFSEPGCGLAHRRLAIIDIRGGIQPLFNEDHSVVVVYNGEIYNFRDLTTELTNHGHRFRTSCDTEVIVHAWEQWGEGCVERFRGMFAFALFDRKKQVLFLARDRLGIKPLYYSISARGQLVFGSELKALLVHPEVSRGIDPRAVEDYFAFGYVPDPKTIYAGVYKLPPAHHLLCERNSTELQLQRYWTLPSMAGESRNNEADTIEELTAGLREAVELRMVADVPIGAFLSGGVDSSTVVSLMASLSNEPINTCSIAFRDDTFDESPYAETVAQQYGTRHFVDTLDSVPPNNIDRLATTYDEPFADSSAVPTFEVCAMARRRVTVALSGDGGDEIFWGYTRYRWHDDEARLRRRLLGLGTNSVVRWVADAWPLAHFWPQLNAPIQTLQALGRSPPEAYFHTLCLMKDRDRKTLFAKDLIRDLQGYRAFEVFSEHYQVAPSDHPVGKIQYIDLMTYLPGDILTKVDRASMANSLEVRLPLLDHPLVEWAQRLSPTAKLRNGTGKYILKKAAESYLPKELIYRRKMGFAVPLDDWFRGPLREKARESLLGPSLLESGLFQPDRLESMIDQHQEGVRNHGSALWALLMFEAFLRTVHSNQ